MSRRECLNYAEYCLEQWAMWKLDNNGFPSTSSIFNLSRTRNDKARASIPIGVEIKNNDILLSMKVFKAMESSSEKSAKRSDLLKRISLVREKNETLLQAMRKIEKKPRRADYYEAIEEFAIRLEMLINY